jgi:hypothetical protein
MSRSGRLVDEFALSIKVSKKFHEFIEIALVWHALRNLSTFLEQLARSRLHCRRHGMIRSDCAALEIEIMSVL